MGACDIYACKLTTTSLVTDEMVVGDGRVSEDFGINKLILIAPVDRATRLAQS